MKTVSQVSSREESDPDGNPWTSGKGVFKVFLYFPFEVNDQVIISRWQLGNLGCGWGECWMFRWSYLGGNLGGKEQNGCKQPCNRIWTNNGMKSFLFFLLFIRPTVIQKNNQKQILDVAPRQCPPWGPCNSASTTGYISSSRERHAEIKDFQSLIVEFLIDHQSSLLTSWRNFSFFRPFTKIRMHISEKKIIYE